MRLANCRGLTRLTRATILLTDDQARKPDPLFHFLPQVVVDDKRGLSTARRLKAARADSRQVGALSRRPDPRQHPVSPLRKRQRRSEPKRKTLAIDERAAIR